MNKLYDFIEEKLTKDGNEEKAALWSVLKEATNDCKAHLSQITAQLNDFDIHDANHSEKVLENIESLLGVKMADLSFLEATLIYASCFFHDAAMALPKWEYDLLKAFEGCEEHYNRDVKPCIKNDFKPVQSLNEIKKIIDDNKKFIYIRYSDVESYIFAPENEAELQIDLAKRVRSYEEFRNGFSDQLRNKRLDGYDYLNYSNLIRCEFIRSTHNKRIIELIGYMRKRFREKLKKRSAADKYLSVLGDVCKAHGDEAVDVKKLPFEYEIDALGKVNVQFVAIMLRLGDIIHFSSDRAPMSLFAEKKITDPLSYKHWKSKFEETRYEFSRSDSKTTVKFKAYCSSPDTYFFLQYYLDCIDDEIALFFAFLQRLEYDDIPNRKNYDIKITTTTDRTGIEADTSIFTPENDAKFTLEQSKILALLTGAQLYKDEYLCLRELYQNSLDACKCMKAIDKTRNVCGNYLISFGLSTDSNGRKYIYCLDNGTGMTMDIVKNYLLRIGNSYYKSRDFMRRNADWSNAVNPTSQFGIGILSCFMLGDALEITTKHYENANITLSFVIEGVNEWFYRIPTNELDNERIGEHGTLVKIILNEKTSETINCCIPKDLHYFIFAGDNSMYDKTFDKSSYKEFENSLFWKVNKQIGIPSPKIEVCVYDENDKPHLIIPFNDIFDFRKYKSNVAAFATVWERYHFRDGIENPYKDVITCRDFIKDIPVSVEIEGVQLHTFICLPQKGIPVLNRYIFSFSRYLWRTSQLTILVDGVFVKENSAHLSKHALLGYSLSQNSSVILNFTGEKRPILSVDRNNIINFSEDITEVLKKLVDKLITKVVEAVVAHLKEEELGTDSAETQLAINTVLYTLDGFSGDILKQLSATEYDSLKLDKLTLANQKINSLSELFSLPDATFKNIDIRQLDDVSRQIVFGKAFLAEAIEVMDESITIKSNQFFPPSYALKEDRTILHRVQYVLKADKWEGCFEQYDLVTSLWPVVPERLYDKITELEREDNYSLDDRRIKLISQTGNGLYGMGIIEPALVNPKIGISSHKRERFGKSPCLIGRVEDIQNSFFLFELNSYRRLAREEHKDYVLYEYIAPREITDEDELKLKDYIGQDDTYVQGVREGWSILFLGYDSTYYILPGVHKREDLIELVPPSIRARKNGIEYYNLDGIKLNF